MNVTFVTGSVSRMAGGLFTSVRRTAQTLTDDGNQVRVVGLQDRFTRNDIDSWDNVRPVAMVRRGPAAFGYAPRISRVVNNSSPDIVHTHGLWLYVSHAASTWSRRTGGPHVVSPRGMLDPWALANSRWKKRLAGWLYEHDHLARAACIHALCASEARSIRQFGLKNPICIIPNGVDMPEKPCREPPPWAGQTDPDEKVLLYLGRIHPKKGLTELLDGWASIMKRGTGEHPLRHWRLAIAGWSQGGYEGELKRLARERKIEESVLFLGPQFGDGKAACFANCDGFILPSHSEGLPMVVLEAWSYGLPVIMTQACNLPEGESCGAAICVEPVSDSVARGVRQLVSMTDEARWQMGRNGRRLAVERFSWQHVVNQLGNVYSWLLGDAARPDTVLLH